MRCGGHLRICIYRLDSGTDISSKWLCDLHVQRGTQQRTLSLEKLVLSLNMGRTGCADLKDRVYSTLSLVDPQMLAEDPIDVNYELSPRELYLQLTERCREDRNSQLRSRFRIAMACMLDTQA